MSHSNSVDSLIRLQRLARAPLAAAFAWHGYCVLGRGFIYMQLGTPPNLLVHYYSSDQFWEEIPLIERTDVSHRAMRKLLSSYIPQSDYVVCIPKNSAAAAIEMICFNHHLPRTAHEHGRDLGLFHSGDGVQFAFAFNPSVATQ